jgi:hypothetical protein
VLFDLNIFEIIVDIRIQGGDDGCKHVSDRHQECMRERLIEIKYMYIISNIKMSVVQMKDTHGIIEWVNIVIDIVEGLDATDKIAVIASWVQIEIGSLLNITIAKKFLKLKI